ncbi:DNA-3-methyladenine glycosylase I [Alkalimonas mucilaginosa]|uniref:DNA-3-methyladenine glycosylase I n=1 Tax=Alkalimonas mucilaginosa TaxID=3057676 RepID=A0ABU7JCB8_9GAMM|nr:DNA-3-methyladenine glycosylase I [Alkalimonas sp. MEB004]MEE2023242.1 DNA-3-methyladenine glycosylase I [Alkalimonas sp. MEB004]
MMPDGDPTATAAIASRRCPWLDCSKADYVAYHDDEWGVPLFDDQKLFEFITLEAAQAGLSWYTVLKKRPHYRQVFAGFAAEQVARFDQQQIEQLLQDPGIIRNRLKVEAAVNNARCFLAIQEAFGSFAAYQWRFVDGRPQVSNIRGPEDYRATSKASDAMSKDLKQRGFKFVGSTIIYAHMQACGMVNDHSLNCFRRQQIIDSYPALGLG